MHSGPDLIARRRIEDLEVRLQQKEADIAMLSEIAAVIGSEYSLEKVFELVAERAGDLIQAETITIPVLSPDGTEYTYRAAVGAHADELKNSCIPIEVGVCGWVLRHRKAWWRGVLNELDEQERNRWEQDAGSLILVPLIGKRQFLGGIAGINKRGGGEFDLRDLDLLGLFAGQVSIAIENAMFFEELNAAREAAEAFRARLEESNERLSRANEELQHLVVHDPLTQLPNRTLIADRLQQGILGAQRNRHTSALIMVDLDHFKEVNDTLGHAVGDALLINVGKRFLNILRAPDTLGRLGGDEFAIVLPKATQEEAIIVARKLQGTLQKPVSVEQNSFSISASMGIAMYPEHGADPSTLLKSADVAMYVAKSNRDELAVYNPADDKHNPDRLELLRDLRTAIREQQIGLAFQPTLDLRSGTLVGIEALARWTHPTRGPVAPSEFIPALEQTGLIKPFTLQVLEQAIRACKRCQEQGFDLSVSVNVSVHNLRDNYLEQQIDDLLDQYEFDAGKLVLEITESAIMQDPEYSLGILGALNAMGVRLSIDDFGTGYSSLSYLKRLPVQQLKIDQSFVSHMLGDNDDAMIVRSTIDLAHNLGLHTVAEGVETRSVLEALQKMHCDIAQGYFISHPLPIDDLLKCLENGDWQVMPDRGDAAAG